MDFFEGWDAKRKRHETPSAPVAPIPAAGTATPYALAALQGEVENVQAVPIGSGRNHQLNVSALKMFRLAAAGEIDPRIVTETLGAADGGLDYPDTRKTIESARRAAFEKYGARIVPESNGGQLSTTTDPFGDGVYTGPLDGGSVSSPEATSRSALPTTAATSTNSAPGAGSESDPDAAYAALVEVEARRVRLNRDARRLVDEQDAAKAFRVPVFLPTLTDELAIPDEPVTYAIDQLIPTGANVLLTAQYKTGKTTMVNNLARSFADGVPFLDRYEVEPIRGRVAMFNYEVDSRQYRRWLREVGIENTDRVAVLNLRGYRLPLTVPHIEDWVVAYLRSVEASVWIVDPFARAFTGLGDENDNGEAGIFLDTLDVIKERAGVGELIMPNHTGRAEFEQGNERGRGATRLDDWADVRWLLTKDKDGTRYFRASGRDVETDEAALTFDEATRHLSIGGGGRKETHRTRLHAHVVACVEICERDGVAASQNTLKRMVRQRGGSFGNDEFAAICTELVAAGILRSYTGPRDALIYRLGEGHTPDPFGD